jgi:hypothetical protein
MMRLSSNVDSREREVVGVEWLLLYDVEGRGVEYSVAATASVSR